VEDAVRAREDLHEEVEVSDAPPANVTRRGGARSSPGRPGGEVVDDDDVVVLCQGVCKVGADEAGPAGDDVAHEEVTLGGCLGLSELSCRYPVQGPAIITQ